MCAQCLQTRYDIGEGISKQVQQNTCRGCGRYERRDGSFAPVEPESAELMALLLKKPRGLGSVRLVDASFIWTEPHSRRIKIKACVQKEVVSGAVMQQSFVIEYMLSNKQCGSCLAQAVSKVLMSQPFVVGLQSHRQCCELSCFTRLSEL